MRIVIDISEDYYKAIKEIPVEQSTVDMMIIRNGIPLPKGHGRLIDADAFIATMEDASKRHKYKELLIDDCLTVDDVFKAVIESLQNRGLAEGDAPTIIEADKEGKRGHGMTIEEAINHIENIMPYAGRNVKDSLDMAIKALERLTPKKVGGDTARLIDLHNGAWKKVGGYKCPECNGDVEYESRFCPHCGQAIDWRTKE